MNEHSSGRRISMQSRPLSKQFIALMLLCSLACTCGTSLASTASTAKNVRELEQELNLRLKQPGASESLEVATILHDIGAAYFDDLRYEQAEPYQRRAVAILRKIVVGDQKYRSSLSRTIEELASTLLEQEKYADAELLFRETLALDESVFGKDSEDAGISMQNLARCLRYRGTYAEAESLILRSLDIRKRSKDASEDSSSATLRNLARLKGLQGKYAEAEQLYRQCITISEKLYKKASERLDKLVPNQVGLANCLIAQGKFKEAKNILLPIATEFGTKVRANAFTDALADPDSQSTSANADSLLQRLEEEQKVGKASFKATELLLLSAINLHFLQADVSPVIDQCYRNSQSFLPAGNSNNSEAGAAKMLVNLALILGAYDEIDKSRKSLETAENDSKEIKNNAEKVESLKSIASCWRLLGDNARAQKVVENARQLAAGDEGQIFDILLLRAHLKQELSEFDDAEADCRAAIDIGARRFGAESARLFEANQIFAECFLATRDDANASLYASRAAKLQGLTPRDQAKAELLLGRCLLATGKSSDAFEHFEKCVQIYGQDKNNDPRIAAAAASGLGEALLEGLLANAKSADSDSIPRAASFFSQALGIGKMDASAGGLLSRARNYDNLALVSYSISRNPDGNSLTQTDRYMGDLDLARRHSIDAASQIDRYLSIAFPYLSFAQQCAFISILKQQQDSLLTLCTDDNSIDKAYGFMLKWKGLLLESVRCRALQTVAANRDPRAKAALENLQVARRKLSGLTNRVSLGESDAAGKVSAAFESKERLERELIALTADTMQDPMANVSLADFRKLLTPGEVFADIVQYRPLLQKKERYAVILSTGGANGSSRYFDLGDASEIARIVQDWRTSTAQEISAGTRDVRIVPLTSDTSKDDGDVKYKQLTSRLVSLLHTMVGNEKAPTKRIWLCSEGEFARIPWNSIGMLSGESAAICEVDSPREFVLLHQKRMVASKSDGNMMIAGLSDFGGSHLPRLPGALKEAELLADLAQKQNLKVQPLLESKATKNDVMLALTDASMAHIATHGFARTATNSAGRDTISSDNAEPTSRGVRLASSSNGVLLQAGARNPLLDCGLYFSDSDESRSRGPASEEATAVLTGDEIVGLDLSGCDLVTLSACQTGLGRGLRGQGVIGLRSSVLGAGARCLLMSLWSIDDDASRELMTRFYTYLWSATDPLPPINALRKAQSDVRNVPKWNAPRFWAGWVIAGNGWDAPSRARR